MAAIFKLVNDLQIQDSTDDILKSKSSPRSQYFTKIFKVL